MQKNRQTESRQNGIITAGFMNTSCNNFRGLDVAFGSGAFRSNISYPFSIFYTGLAMVPLKFAGQRLLLIHNS